MDVVKGKQDQSGHKEREMERLNEKLIGGYEMTRDDRSTKEKETDVWLFISLSDIKERL